MASMEQQSHYPKKGEKGKKEKEGDHKQKKSPILVVQYASYFN